MTESYAICVREASAFIFILIQTPHGGPEAPYLHPPKSAFYDIKPISMKFDTLK